ncbi:MAG: hypothetical protein UZ04_CHB001000450 [Chlorobi bacterium OLB4]|jgi:Predicted membrane protein|nr:MAG: hypothetical protein UZ04_CHB001000450 [Chlorobi bacterium OLB4]MBW7854661.1 TPM domain-containing protein [Ignavibacteria bacterium]OQY78181.1 MAG: hypothetical protein B6D43_03460 [Ignavibacteriales bacterium UTCHB1]
MTQKFLAKYLNDNDLKRIEEKISGVESKTSGEIKLCIKVTRGIYEDTLSPREIAVSEFFNLGMQNTKDRTGILIFILFDERKYEIIADEGIYEKIPEEKWRYVKEIIVNNFRNGNYCDGIIDVINEMGNMLIKEFPADGVNPDELSNEVVVK